MEYPFCYFRAIWLTLLHSYLGHLSQTLKCRTSEIAFFCLQGNCNIRFTSITELSICPFKVMRILQTDFPSSLLGKEILKHSKHTNSQLLTAFMADQESTETPSRFINTHFSCWLHKPATEDVSAWRCQRLSLTLKPTRPPRFLIRLCLKHVCLFQRKWLKDTKGRVRLDGQILTQLES